MSRLMRVLLGDDAVVEVETAEDAVRVVQVYRRSLAEETPQYQSLTAGIGSLLSGPSTPLTLTELVDAKFGKPKPKSPARAVFANGHYPAFLALYRAEKGLNTEAMVKVLALSGPKSLPPTVAAWGKRARAAGLDFRELFEVERSYLHGNPESIYRLTEKGREVFQPEPELNQAPSLVP